MGIRFLAHNSDIFFPIRIKFVYMFKRPLAGFGHVEVILHNLANSGQNIASLYRKHQWVDGVHEPIKSLVMGPC